MRSNQLNLIDDQFLRVKSWNLQLKIFGDYWPINLIEALQPALIHINSVYFFKRQLSLRIRHQHSLSRDSSCRHPIGCFCVVCNNMRRKWRGIIQQLRTTWWRTRQSTFPTDLRYPTGVEWPCTEQSLRSSWPCCRPRTSWSGRSLTTLSSCSCPRRLDRIHTFPDGVWIALHTACPENFIYNENIAVE